MAARSGAAASGRTGVEAKVIDDLVQMGFVQSLAEDAVDFEGPDFERAMAWCLDPKKQHRLQNILTQLVAMGFSRPQSIAGVKAKGYNVEAIIEWISNGMPIASRDADPVVFVKPPPAPAKKEKTFEEAITEIERDLDSLASEAKGVIESRMFTNEKQYLTLKERLTRDVLLKLDALTLPRAKPPSSTTTVTSSPTSATTERKSSPPSSTATATNGFISEGDYVYDGDIKASGSDTDLSLIDFDYEAPDPVARQRRKERASFADALIQQLENIAAVQKRNHALAK